MKKCLFISLAFVVFTTAKSQTTNDVLNLLVKNKVITQQQLDTFKTDPAILPDKKAKIDLDIRPRSEFRDGFKQLRTADTKHAFSTTQRSRAIFNYEQTSKFAAQVSFQDVRTWGQFDNKTVVGSVNIFEAWIEPFVYKNTTIRIGRQKLSFDNQRLFSESDWNAQSQSHDALNVRYNDSKTSSDLAFAFNQNNNDTLFGTNYYNANGQYKLLAVSFIKYKLNDAVTISLLNAGDGYQPKSSTISKDVERIFMRFTNGGRIEYSASRIYATVSGYYQSGKSNENQTINAWYLQPEVSYTTDSKFKVMGTRTERSRLL